MTAGRPAERQRQPPAARPVSVPASAWMRWWSPAAPAPAARSPPPSRRLPARAGRATATRPAVGGALPSAYSMPSGSGQAWWRPLPLAGGGVHGGCDRHSGGCPYHSSITNPANRSISLGPPFNARRDDRGRPAVPFRIAEDRQGQLRGPFEHAIDGCASVALGRPLAGHEPTLTPAKPSRPPSVSRRCPWLDSNGRLRFRTELPKLPLRPLQSGLARSGRAWILASAV